MIGIIKPFCKEFSTIQKVFKNGIKIARSNNQNIFKSVTNGVREVHKHTGTFPLIVGAATGIGFAGVPGTTITGIVAGIFIKKGAKKIINIFK